MTESTSWLINKQPLLHTAGVVIFILLCTLIGPLSSDMYTPAIPHMVDYFNTSDTVVNLTLVLFFAFNAIGLLAFGPISDKLGRKPVLYLGNALYIAGSLLCALSTNIGMLIFFRVFQALGAGAIGAIGTAVVKDAIVPAKREITLSIVNTLFVVGPVFGPIVGAGVMQLSSWRAIFWATVVLGALCLVLTLLLKEPLLAEHRSTEKLARSYGGLVTVCKNKGFSWYLIVACLFDIGFMAYIAVGSYVYIDMFGTSNLGYSLFFAANGLITAAGPFLGMFISNKISARCYTTVLLLVGCIAGIGIICLGHLSPVVFCVIFTVLSLTESGSRSFTTNILLAQQEENIGAASSVINFLHTAAGCLAMLLAVLPWANYIIAIGGCEILGIAVGIVLWIGLSRSMVKVKGIQ